MNLSRWSLQADALTAVVRIGPLLTVADEADLSWVQIESAIRNHTVLELVHRLKLVQDRVSLRGLRNAQPCSCSTSQDASAVSALVRRLIHIPSSYRPGPRVRGNVDASRLLCELPGSLNQPFSSLVCH